MWIKPSSTHLLMHLYCSSTLYLQIIKSTPSALQDCPDITILWPWLTVVTWIIFKSTLWSPTYIRELTHSPFFLLHSLLAPLSLSKVMSETTTRGRRSRQFLHYIGQPLVYYYVPLKGIILSFRHQMINAIRIKQCTCRIHRANCMRHWQQISFQNTLDQDVEGILYYKSVKCTFSAQSVFIPRLLFTLRGQSQALYRTM